MRTLFEIVESAKDGNKPSHDECYWAMLALSALHTFDGQAMLRIYEKSVGDAVFPTVKFLVEDSRERNRKALDKSPQEYVGWNNDPANPEYQRLRRIALGVFDKVTKGKL